MKSPAEPLEDRSSENQPLQFAIISRRFWPFAGSTEFAVADLASAIQRAGHHVEIVTVRWEKNWPADFEFRELAVHRVNRATTGAWGAFRYLRDLIRHINELQPDGIIVYGLGEEAWSIAKSFGGKIPILIRIDNHLLGFRDDKAHLTHRQLASLNTASKIVVESQWTANRLNPNTLIAPEKIAIAPDGMTIDPDHQRSIARQGSARVAISDAHPMLMIEPTQPLVVCGSPMNGDQGMTDLIDAWSMVQKKFANARLWIFGEGKQSQRVWNLIQDNHLVNSVIMPGSFDHLSVVFAAADVYVHPLRSQETCGFLARALVSGICSVVTSTTATEPLVEDEVNGILVPPQNPQSLAEAIIGSLENGDRRDRLGRAATQSLANVYDIDRLLHHYLNPFVPDREQSSGSTSAIQETNSSSLP